MEDAFCVVETVCCGTKQLRALWHHSNSEVCHDAEIIHTSPQRVVQVGFAFIRDVDDSAVRENELCRNRQQDPIFPRPR